MSWAWLLWGLSQLGLLLFLLGSGKKGERWDFAWWVCVLLWFSQLGLCGGIEGVVGSGCLLWCQGCSSIKWSSFFGSICWSFPFHFSVWEASPKRMELCIL